MRIAILHDKLSGNARADELDTMVQVRAAEEALRSLGHEPVSLALSLDFIRTVAELKDAHVDFVLNFVESIACKTSLCHLAPRIIERANLPYSGCTHQALYTTANKIDTKKILRQHELSTPHWMPSHEIFSSSPKDETLYLVKSVTEDCSLGIDQGSIVPQRELPELVRRKMREFGGEWFAEQYIAGREFNIGLLSDGEDVQVLPIAEIVFNFNEGRFPIVDYAAKWEEGSFEYQHCERTFEHKPEDRPLRKRLKAVSLKCWKIFNLSGYARVDFRVDQSGEPWILEINANPGLAPDAGFIAGCQKAGIDYAGLMQRLIGKGVSTAL